MNLKKWNIKIFLSLFTFNVSIVGVNFFPYNLTNNAQHNHNVKNDNEFIKEDNAEVEGYAPNAPDINMHSRIRLTLEITGSTYNALLCKIEADTQLNFLKLFIGSYTSPLIPEWDKTKKEINDTFGEMSEEYNLSHNYFYNLFKDYLENTEKFAKFKNIFTAKNLINNYYPGFNTKSPADAQLIYRQEGIIIQFFLWRPSSTTEPKIWNVSNLVTTLPYYADKTLTLKKYYLLSYVKEGVTIGVTPTMSIKVPSKYSPEESTVSNLLGTIYSEFDYNFHLSSYIVRNELLQIPRSQFSKTLSYDKTQKTVVLIDFYKKDNLGDLVYICEGRVSLYGVR